MELNGWASPQMLRRYGASARSARARRTYDRIMTDTDNTAVTTPALALGAASLACRGSPSPWQIKRERVPGQSAACECRWAQPRICPRKLESRVPE